MPDVAPFTVGDLLCPGEYLRVVRPRKGKPKVYRANGKPPNVPGPGERWYPGADVVRQMYRGAPVSDQERGTRLVMQDLVEVAEELDRLTAHAGGATLGLPGIAVPPRGVSVGQSIPAMMVALRASVPRPGEDPAPVPDMAERIAKLEIEALEQQVAALKTSDPGMADHWARLARLLGVAGRAARGISKDDNSL